MNLETAGKSLSNEMVVKDYFRKLSSTLSMEHLLTNSFISMM